MKHLILAPTYSLPKRDKYDDPCFPDPRRRMDLVTLPNGVRTRREPSSSRRRVAGGAGPTQPQPQPQHRRVARTDNNVTSRTSEDQQQQTTQTSRVSDFKDEVYCSIRVAKEQQQQQRVFQEDLLRHQKRMEDEEEPVYVSRATQTACDANKGVIVSSRAREKKHVFFFSSMFCVSVLVIDVITY